MAILGSTTLTGCNSIPDFIASGSLMLFKQSTAPTSWVKQTTHNNKTLRVVSGTVSPGGSIAFSSAFPSASTVPISAPVSVTGSVGNTTLTIDQIPSHNHPSGGVNSNNRGIIPVSFFPASTGTTPTGNTGGSGAHNHPISSSPVPLSSTVDLRVQYVDVIVASKN
ncbi:MAG: hypothetical protein ACO3UU_05330 [Minisyncoccia bacterium]